jgi:hypothetical protein
MFTLAFEYSHRVLFSRFMGLLTSDDLAQFEQAARSIIAREGPMRGILDFSEVGTIAVPRSLFIQLGRRPQLSPGQDRVFVATTPEVDQIASAYAAQQRDFGNVEPRVVGSLAEAFNLLGLVRPDFQAIR